MIRWVIFRKSFLEDNTFDNYQVWNTVQLADGSAHLDSSQQGWVLPIAYGVLNNLTHTVRNDCCAPTQIDDVVLLCHCRLEAAFEPSVPATVTSFL